jgi:hypothetical protein
MSRANCKDFFEGQKRGARFRESQPNFLPPSRHPSAHSREISRYASDRISQCRDSTALSGLLIRLAVDSKELNYTVSPELIPDLLSIDVRLSLPRTAVRCNDQDL